MLLLSFVLFCIMFVLGISISGSTLGHFIDYPSIVLVVGGLLAFVLGSGQWSIFCRGLKLLVTFGSLSEREKRDAVDVAKFFKTLSFFSIAIGGLWSLVGMILILANLNPETIGSAIAVTLLTLFYSFTLSVTIFLPISIQYRNLIHHHHRQPAKKFDFNEKFPASYT